MNVVRQVAIVTGGAGGIGRSIVARLVKENCIVIIADVNPEAAEFVVHMWRKEATHVQSGDIEPVLFYPCDVSRESDVLALRNYVQTNFGKLHYLVNNAGIFRKKKLSELSLEEWTNTLNTNLTSVFLMVKSFSDILIQCGGSVVNISSTRAMMSEPNTEAYSATKGGIVALTHALAMSYGSELRINCISPGWIHVGKESPSMQDHLMHPAGRVGVPADVASMAYFLLCSENDFITGQNFVVDGGMSVRMNYEF
jgi:NAD(P)-dependent dehydrogenase (short-subunit alcohol dehydrogenase family)